MTSITWKKVTGSVSIPFEERGSRRRNSSAACNWSSKAAGSRRLLSISSEAAATTEATAAARAITLRSPARSAEFATSVATGQACRTLAVAKSAVMANSLSISSMDLPLVSSPKT